MMNKQSLIAITAALLLPGLSPVWAQQDMGNMKMEQAVSRKPAMQGGPPPADARDPHAWSDGYGFGDIPRPVFADEHNFGSLLVDRFEGVWSSASDDTALVYDLQAWYGRDYDRVQLKAEGDVVAGRLEEASTELLWSHAVASYWNTQLGLRYDSGEAPDRTWLAFGIQGLAPYWFEVDATGYFGQDERWGFNLEASYEWLFTQKLILQSRFETDFYSKEDVARQLGSGLTDMSLGFRLRYEFRREFAPYLGVEWAHKIGDTAALARLAGQEVRETRYVAGVRFWF